MNDEVFALATQLVSPSYVAQAQQARRARETKFKSLLAQRRLPDNGWDEGTLRLLLEELALMDSNAFIGNAGVGEREARIACPLVRSRHFGFGHGIGRSGDIAEEQPKAAGSSLLYKLTNFLAADAIKRAGALSVNVNCLVLPVATGMTVTLTMLALRAMRPAAKYVVWPRIDQKSCLKAVAAAGCTPLVVESLLEGDELRTNVPGVRARIEECTQCMKAIAAASKHGRLDAFIQSTDKNFLVPVGGAILASCSAEFGAALIAKVSATYPGRASIAPILDLFITLLHLGADGWASLLERRQRLLPIFRERLGALAASHGERLLVTPNNSISMAVTLTSGGGGRSVTAMGAQLWVRLISGARICAPDAKKKSVAGIAFTNYGSHCDAYPVAYFTAACALGATEEDLDLFLKRLDKTLKEWKKMKPLAAESPA
ncbi:o-phosphoseryl-tRNA selenium transferase, partial [Chrysochromulina tobinii]